MKITKPSGVLKQYLDEIGVSAKTLHLHDGELAKAITLARKQHPEDGEVEIEARAIARLAYKQFAGKKPTKIHRAWWIALLLLCLLLAKAAHGQTPVNIDRVGGTKIDYSLGMPVFCVSGCGSGGGAITAPLDVSGNVKVAIQNASIAVTGAFFQSTQPVSIATMPTTPVTGTFWQNTQPISAAALPLPSGAATESTLATLTKPADQQHAIIDSSATLPTQETGSGTVLSGQQAVTGTAAALATNSAKKACVKALSANTINIYVGPSGITTSTGFELTPGSAVCMPVTNTNLLYVVASTTGANAAWLATF